MRRHEDSGEDEGRADEVIPEERFAEEDRSEQRAEHRHQVNERARPLSSDARDRRVPEEVREDRGEDRVIENSSNRGGVPLGAAATAEIPHEYRNQHGDPDPYHGAGERTRRELRRPPTQSDRVNRPAQHRSKHP
jgi:hypothetical protein